MSQRKQSVRMLSLKKDKLNIQKSVNSKILWIFPPQKINEIAESTLKSWLFDLDQQVKDKLWRHQLSQMLTTAAQDTNSWE